MFNKNFRPLPQVVNYQYCDYDHLPYKIRQKMRTIQGYLIDIRNLSKNNYKLCLLDDGCLLLDPLRNKILWKFDYFSSIGILMHRLEELTRFYLYETHVKTIKTLTSRNDYFTLKQKYYVS